MSCLIAARKCGELPLVQALEALLNFGLDATGLFGIMLTLPLVFLIGLS